MQALQAVHRLSIPCQQAPQHSAAFEKETAPVSCVGTGAASEGTGAAGKAGAGTVAAGAGTAAAGEGTGAAGAGTGAAGVGTSAAGAGMIAAGVGTATAGAPSGVLCGLEDGLPAEPRCMPTLGALQH